MVRVGIAGIGYIAEEYIKLFFHGKIHGAKITALSSRNESHMQAVNNRYHLNASLFTDYGTMLHSGTIDAVIICTPHFYHPAMATQAIQAEIHTMIEKPVGVYPEELDALANCIQKHPHIKSGVLYCRRTKPVFQKIRDLLTDGTLGALKRITWIVTDMYRPQCYFDETTWRGTYSGEGGGLLMNQVSHHIDLLVWLCGLPEALQARCYTARERNIEVENEVSVTAEYPGNAISQFIASTREYPGTNRLEISCSRGQIILEKEQDLTLRRLETDERDFAVRTNQSYPSIFYTEEIFHFETAENTVIQSRIINNFIEAIAADAPVICPVTEAIMSQQFIQAAYLSSWQEKKLYLPVDEKAYTEELRKRIK